MANREKNVINPEYSLSFDDELWGDNYHYASHNGAEQELTYVFPVLISLLLLHFVIVALSFNVMRFRVCLLLQANTISKKQIQGVNKTR